MSKKEIIWVVVGSVLMVLVGIATLRTSTPYQPAQKLPDIAKGKHEPKQDTCTMKIRHEAKAVLEMHVSEMLVSPKTAEFSPISKTQISCANNLLTLHGYVDSQNRMGAMIRTRYTGTVKLFADGQYRVISVDTDQ